MRAGSWLQPSEYAETVTNVSTVIEVAERFWPAAGAEEWDVVGLSLGSRTAKVSRVLVAVDITEQTVAEAISLGCELLVSHHPLLLKGVTSLPEDAAKGSLVAKLVGAGIAVFSAHTNADVTVDGTSAFLAEALDVARIQPIVTGSIPETGLGRVGTLASPMTLDALAQRVATVLPATAAGVRFAGDPDREVHRVAVCAGAGDSLLGHPVVQAADVYITADLRHHPASDALELVSVADGPALIDVSHWASEWLWVDHVAKILQAELPGVEVTCSHIVTDPWTGHIPSGSGGGQ